MAVVMKKFSPPNSVVAIMDRLFGMPGQFKLGKIISDTETCVTVGTKMEYDGETTFVMGPRAELTPVGELRFRGRIQTPNMSVAICDVSLTAILELSVSGTSTAIEVWSNAESEPDQVTVIVD